MRLARLHIHGFKTFANRTEFHFPGGLTAVVGPNGSGKSNVADAIRWVLGEQAYSVLRVKRTEDLIFTGSAKRPRMGMAEVALTLENPQALEAEPLPTNGNGHETSATRENIVLDLVRARPSEVTVTRRAYRSGENEYLINSQRVRLRDIQELMQHWGLARNSYAVVGQGLIDTALSLRPEERRTLFEEAAGIGLYQSKKANALEKLAETQQNLLRINDIINEIAPRLPSLSRQAERARNYQGVADALQARLKQWYAFQWARAQERFKEVGETERSARVELNSRRTDLMNLAGRLSAIRREAQELRAQQSLRLRERSTLESAYAGVARDLAVLEERGRLLAQQMAEANTEIAGLESARGEHAARVTRAAEARRGRETDHAQMVDQVRRADTKKKDLEAARARLVPEDPSRARELAQRLAQIGQGLHLYEQSLPQVAGLASRAELLARAENERRELSAAVEQARLDLSEARTSVALAERDVAAARAQEDHAQGSLREIENQLQARRNKEADLARALAQLDHQRAGQQTRADSFAHQLAQIEQAAAPEELGLAERERLQIELEEAESTARARLSEYEAHHNRLILEAERARAEIDRLETEIEDDLGAVELDGSLPRQLRLRLGEDLVTLPDVTQIPENLEKEIRKLKNQMRYMGSVNPNAPQEYEELRERHTFLTTQAADLNTAIERLHTAVGELDEIMHKRFKETFDAIKVQFARYFNLLFGGGTARLELTEPSNLTETGVEIIARPPGKRASHLAMLSGGERSLTAQALLFSILKVSPISFCVLDEVDAMLDEANVGRFRDALRDLSQETQFSVITHNRATIEVADTVYGISMGDDGVSQVISLRLDRAQAPAAR